MYTKCICVDGCTINDIAKQAFQEGYKRCADDWADAEGHEIK